MNRLVVLLVLVGVKNICAFDWSPLQQVRRAHAGRAYSKQRYADAQHAYESLVLDDVTDQHALLGLANTFYAQKQFAQAGKYYELLAKNARNNTEREAALFNGGCAAAQQQRYQEALALFEAVVRINANNKRAQKNIEILKKQAQQPKKQNPPSGKQQQDKNSQQNQKGDSQNTGSNDNKGHRDNTGQNKKPDRDGLQNPRDSRSAQQQNKTPESNQADQTRTAHDATSGKKDSHATESQYTKPQKALLEDAQKIENEARAVYIRHSTHRNRGGEAVHGW